MKEQKTNTPSRELPNVSRPGLSNTGDQLRASLNRNKNLLMSALPDESLVVDHRCALTPAQAVEGKLINLLRNDSLPVSHLQLRGLVRGRCEV